MLLTRYAYYLACVITNINININININVSVNVNVNVNINMCHYCFPCQYYSTTDNESMGDG